MKKRKWVPRKGQVFDDRDTLEAKLLESGWVFEGHGTGLDGGEVTGFDVGVTDEKEKVWILVDMEPVVRVTKVKRMKLPYLVKVED